MNHLQRTRVALSRTLLAFLIATQATASVRSLWAYDAPTKYVVGFMGVNSQFEGVSHVLGFINPEGTGEYYPDFGHPDQRSWVFGPQFEDGHRIVLTSYGDSDVTRVRAGEVTTRNWIFDLRSRDVTEIAQRDRLSAQVRSQVLLPGDERILMSAIINHEERLFTMDLDGGRQQEITEAGGGFHYAVELSPDRTRLACHVTGGKPSFYNPGAYSINVIDLGTQQRVLVAGQLQHLYFGPRWSPDGAELVYLDCELELDPQHFRSALCIGQVDGSGSRLVTPPQSHWFGTPFGSNMAEWTPDGQSVTYTRLLPGSERDMSRGGSQICLVHVETGKITELTTAEEGRWDYRTAHSPDGKILLFTRVRSGGRRELWAMSPDGTDQRKLTSGYQQMGADFPRWLKVEAHAH